MAKLIRIGDNKLNKKDAMLEVRRAILADDGPRVTSIISEYKELLTTRTPYAGATWLHYASREGLLEAVNALLAAGAEVNHPGFQEGEVALCRAANGNQIEVAELLLKEGSILDTSTPSRNPLFCSVVGKSPEIAKLVLKYGIDANVQYSGGMNAIAFALMYGETDIAELIAAHLAKGDNAKSELLLSEAADIVGTQGELEQQRIVPTS